MAAEFLIKAEQLSRHYGSRLAVDNVSFDLSSGEVLGFLGPNGAGKSTTMQMISGNLAPSAGQVFVNGFDMVEQAMLAKAEIGYLPEQPPVYRDLTVNEYLEYCAQLHKIRKPHRNKAIETAKQRCGLEECSKRLIGNLSKGFQQRVGIAQAILHNPSIVILDEPTVGLDPNQIREIRNLIVELGKDRGIILSTHILAEVQATCSRVQIIDHGKMVFSEDMKSLQSRLNGQLLMLETSNSMDASKLESIEGVHSVNLLAHNRAQLHFNDNNPANQVASCVLENDWGLQELSLEKQTLEQVFIDLTCKDLPQIAEMNE